MQTSASGDPVSSGFPFQRFGAIPAAEADLVTHKVCTHCHISKPVTQFHHRYWCDECVTKDLPAWRNMDGVSAKKKVGVIKHQQKPIQHAEYYSTMEEDQPDPPVEKEVKKLTKSFKHNALWSPVEDRYVTDNFKSKTIEDISTDLKRTPASVKSRMYELGLI